MKICPQCNKTYEDNNLNFCLDDGSVLKQIGGSTQDNFGDTIKMNQGDIGQSDLPPTMIINQPPITTSHQSQNPGFNTGFGGQQNQTNWNNPPQTAQSAPKGSKSWLWVVGILGVLVLVCGGGLIGFFALVNNFEDNTNLNSDPGSNKTVVNTKSRDASPTPNDRKNTNKVNLSEWMEIVPNGAKLDYKNGELLMSVDLEGYYYAIVAGSLYKTENATTTLTVRNPDSVSSDLGYGLVFHSDPKPFVQGYAFLIDTDQQRYRIVRHVPNNEYVVVNWTKDDAVKSGSAENVLEVRDEGSEMKFYINGTLVTTKPNAFGARGGIAGLYVGTTSPIAFSNFEVRK